MNMNEVCFSDGLIKKNNTHTLTHTHTHIHKVSRNKQLGWKESERKGKKAFIVL